MKRATANNKRPKSRRAAAAKSDPAAGAYRTIYVLSDSTGNLPRHMVTAFLTQFPQDTFAVRSRNFLDSPRKVEAALEDVGASPGIVMHAFVLPAVKKQVADRCRKLKLPVCDLTGSFVEFLSKASGVPVSPDLRRLHDVDAAYRRRVKAIEFALEHDDGLGLDTLHQADVVLVGVSRTSKTPTCMYLAQQGLSAGNYAMAVGVEPPAEVMSLPREKVAALVIDPVQLAQIRTRRQVAWGMGDTRYNDASSVAEEVEWSRKLFARQRWTVFDVTNQAIEETAARIADKLGLGSAK